MTGLASLAPFLLATAIATSPQDIVQRPPSIEAFTAVAQADGARAYALLSAEAEACVAQGGDEPTIETIGECASLIMQTAQWAAHLGKAEEAIELADAATGLSKAVYGQGSDIEGYARQVKARALLELFRIEEAHVEAEAALAIARTLYEADSPDITPFLSGVAQVEIASSNGAKAKALLEEAIAIENDKVFLAQMQVQLGVALLLTEEPEDAASVLHKAATSLAEMAGETAPEAIEARIRLANALYRLKRYDEALAIVDAALPTIETQPALEWLLVDTLFVKGGSLGGMRDFAAAAPVVERARALADRLYGSENAQTVSLAELSSVYAEAALNASRIGAPDTFWAAYQASDFVTAEEIIKPLIRDCVTKHSPDAFDAAKLAPCVDLFSVSAMVNSNRNRLERAKELASLAVEIAERGFGSDSAALGLALMAQGSVFSQTAEFNASIAILERSVDILGEDNPIAVGALSLLATAQQQIGNATAALETLAKAKRLTDDPVEQVNFLDIEVLSLVALGRTQEAVEASKAVIDLALELPFAQKLKLDLAYGFALTRALRHQEAIAVLEPLVPQMRANFGEHPVLGRALDTLGQAYLRGGQAREAVDTFRQSLAIFRALLGEASVMTGLGYNNLAIALLQSGEGNESGLAMVKAMNILIESGSDNSEWIANVMVNLSRFVELAEKPELSIQLSRKALEFFLEREDEKHPLVAKIRGMLASGLLANGQLNAAMREAERSFVAAKDVPEALDTAAGSAAISAIAATQLGDIDKARAWHVLAAEYGARAFAETDSNRVSLAYRFGEFELEQGGRYDVARSLLRFAADKTRERIEGYTDFDAAAQAEMRSFAVVYRDQVKTAWLLADDR